MRITYYQYLPLERGVARYVYPLETRQSYKSSTDGHVYIQLDLRSEVPIAGFMTPGFQGEVSREIDEDHHVRTVLNRNRGDLERDFVFTYRLDTRQDALNLLTYKKPGEDGYFLLLATASDGRVVEEPVNYTFVIDVSGSMRRGRKIDIAAEGIVRFLKASNREDRFNCLTFNVTPDLMSPDSMENRDMHPR